jgi:hypothetical protein
LIQLDVMFFDKDISVQQEEEEEGEDKEWWWWW